MPRACGTSPSGFENGVLVSLPRLAPRQLKAGHTGFGLHCLMLAVQGCWGVSVTSTVMMVSPAFAWVQTHRTVHVTCVLFPVCRPYVSRASRDPLGLPSLLVTEPAELSPVDPLGKQFIPLVSMSRHLMFSSFFLEFLFSSFRFFPSLHP